MSNPRNLLHWTLHGSETTGKEEGFINDQGGGSQLQRRDWISETQYVVRKISIKAKDLLGHSLASPMTCDNNSWENTATATRRTAVVEILHK